MNRLLTLLLLSVLNLAAYGQGKQITGRVTDSDGNGLPGATVMVKATTTGVVTDVDGNFKITVPGNEAILVFSFIGYLTQEIQVNEQTSVSVQLTTEASKIDEVVVIGYGTQKKKDLTTAVTVVGLKEIKDRPMVSAAEALQGKAAGVQVVSPSGKPGSDLSVRVRGATSVLAGNEPLYVVDGVPTTDIKGLSPTDISSMSVLKDASSAAIYGARAANGVVIITTKRGKENTPTIGFSTYYGMSNLRKPIEVLSTKKYRDLVEEITGTPVDPAATGYTNWSDKTFGTGQTQSYQLSFSGGSKTSQYFISAGYLSDLGIVKPARFDRYTIRLNLDNEIKPWLTIGTSINTLNLKTKDTPDNASSGRGGVIMSALNTPPFLHVYKQDGSGWFDPNPYQPSWENPVAYMEGADQEAIDNQLFANFKAEVRLHEGLFFKSRFGIDISSHQWDYYLDPFRTNYGRNNNGIGRADKSNSNTWLWENTLDYTKSIGNHNLTGLVGSSIQKNKWNDSYLDGSDFPADVSVKTLNAANVISGNSTIGDWALASFFGRATYDYNSKYYLTFSLRRDGSSKLAHHWGTMPAFSAGWRISAEPFMKNITLIDDMKLRGGWGKNGNQEGIPNYVRFGLISYYRQTPTIPLSGPISVQTTYGNPDLRWETTAQSNIGFDLSMFKYRLTLNLDAYYKKTSDVLLNVQLPSTSSISSIQTNAGVIANKGVEFNINTVNMDKRLRWTTDFNMSFNRNKVIKMELVDMNKFGKIYSNNDEVAIVKKGLPLGSFYGFIAEGVDTATGNMIYKDYNKNGIFDEFDKTVIGNGQPKFTFGLTNSFTYKRFDLRIFIQGSYGNDIYNATRIDLEGMFDSKNQSLAVLRRWTPTNKITDIPKAITDGDLYNVRNSTRFVEDGSYVRLKSLTLSCKAIDSNPKIKAIKTLSIYVTGQNLITLTNYSGFDPEVNAYGNSATEVGIDYGTYPQSRSVIVGLNVEF
jgi:TonB-dependent starch-binding outer membrane protein SusC